MIKLLKNAQVYSPAPLGKKDVLVIGDKVARIDDSIQGYDGLPEVEVIDLKGKKLLPGYIDIHIHITGGGGEQGFTSRVPESQLSVIVGSGITTVLIPKDNVRDLEEIDQTVRAALKFIPVETIDQVFAAALTPMPEAVREETPVFVPVAREKTEAVLRQ